MSAQSSDRNAFLAELSPADYELFRPHLTGFTLTAGERLQHLDAAVEQVVFPHGGLVALTMPLRTGGGGGAILVGRDGFVGGVGAAAVAPAMCDAEVYIGGRAARMSASAFRYVLDQSAAVRRFAARHAAALMVQAHQTALCNAAHPVEARISRWLLEVLDRSGGFDVPLTQSTLAQMLGVQRTTVNLAAGRLEAAGLINCRRGYIQIARREQLERHACECYRSVKAYVSRLFAPPPAPGAAQAAAEAAARKPA
jgi:CRP-like cAMP-binding protein